MRILNAILCILMILFIAVQFNDPDGLIWAMIYAVPAIWAGLAAFKPEVGSTPGAYYTLCACVLSGLVMTAIYWPKTPGFWKQDVWWETETAREGMGIMIATLVLLIVLLSVWRVRKTSQPV